VGTSRDESMVAVLDKVRGDQCRAVAAALAAAAEMIPSPRTSR